LVLPFDNITNNIYYIKHKGGENMFQEIKRKSLIEEVVDQVLSLIYKKELNPGDKLPTERKLAEEFRISRPLVREAISILFFLGIIKKRQGKGNYITKHLNAKIINSSFRYFLFSKEEEVQDFLEARKILECELVKLAARRRTPEDLKEIIQKINELKDYKEKDERRAKIDYEIHSLIAKASKNKTLQSFQTAFGERILDLMKLGVYFPKEVFNTINQEHFLIYKAIENSNDKEAAKIMEKHMKKLEFEHIITEFLNQ